MSKPQTNLNKGAVDELHLKYLEASFEGFRRSTHSLIVISGGAVAALLGLFPVLLPDGLGVAKVASVMKWPVMWFVFSIVAAVVAQIMFFFSTHSAAWGKVACEKRFRVTGIVFVLLGTVFFAVAAFAAVEVMGDSSWQTKRQNQQVHLWTGLTDKAYIQSHQPPIKYFI